jgi:hypothetical protein
VAIHAKEWLMKRGAILLAIFTACGGCQSQVSEPSSPDAAENAAAANVAPSRETIAPGQPGGLPDHRNLVLEGPIDPKSAQGAGQVLQSYAALLEQGRFAEARRLWSDGGAASGLSDKGFAQAYSKFAEIHGEVGAPGQMEGAAGSAYIDIPFRLYGKLKSGGMYNSVGTVTLRRVNDVPGSTGEQRRWRLLRTEMQPPL